MIDKYEGYIKICITELDLSFGIDYAIGKLL